MPTHITGVQIENPSPVPFTVFDGKNTQELKPGMPGNPAKLNLEIQIATYTINNGTLVAGKIKLAEDGTLTITPGNCGLTTAISIITQLAPKK
ncbi:hypothetical protein E5D57_001637 [Metarhizium anisopliae]|nr:hypothetical protein E5D57_001637 [Metarhizium anisopliae]